MMTDKEKIELLEEILDLEEGTLHPGDELNALDDWDSLAILSYVAMIDSDFHRTIDGEVVKKFTTIRDAMEEMR